MGHRVRRPGKPADRADIWWGMKAVGVIEYGGPEALEVVDLPEPEVTEGRVRIRVHAAAVSPTDTYVRNGARAEFQRESGPPPYVPGMDVAGVLEQIGPGVETDLHLGDHVMAIVVPKGSRGGYSELVVVPIESVARVPAGAFGGYAVQLARADGLTVVADASATDEELVRSLGADVVLPRGERFAAAVRSHFPSGVDGAADGALLGERLAPAVKDGGTVITVRGFEETGERGVRFQPIWVREYAHAADKLDRLRQQVEDGQVTLRVAGVYPKEQAAETHSRLEAGGVRGRLVIEF